MDDMIDGIPEAESGLLKYPLVLIDLSIIPPEAFVGHPALRALLEALQRASEGKLVDNFDRITDYFREIKDDPRAKGWLHSIVRYAMSVGKVGKELIVKAYCKLFNEVEAQEMTMTTAQELLLEGKIEGKIEGKTETGRNMVLTALRKKFVSIPRHIEEAVLSMTDPIALESMLEHVFDSNTLDEFATML
jgi:hypothetical protein